jgi:hypothetical protein
MTAEKVEAAKKLLSGGTLPKGVAAIIGISLPTFIGTPQ